MDEEDGWVDPHTEGECCHACGFAAELERTGVPPPRRGAQMLFPLDKEGAPQGAVLVVKTSRDGREADAYDLRRPEIVVGRTDVADVVIPDRVLSRRQLQLTFNEEGVFVEDLGSACGTFINGRRIAEREPLTEGDKVLIGNTTLELVRIPT